MQKLLERRDCFSWTAHARKRSKERRFNADDVRRVLIKGTIAANPEWHENTLRYRYRVCGRDYDDEPLAIIVTIEPALGVITIITGTDC
ncbi:MAG: DUF4258 domain-containing protein [Acidobacteriota bacterium]